MADLPTISDLLHANFGTQPWVLSDAFNRNAAGALVGPRPEAQAGSRPTAEWKNGVAATLRQLSTFVRGTASVDAWSVSNVLKLPVYTTAGRPAAAVAGRVIYDSDLDTLLVDTGAAWVDLTPSNVLFEVDFSALASNAFVNGNETIDGLTWTTANSANAGATWGLDGSTGLRHTTPANLSSVFNSTTQTAAYAYVPLASLPDWVPGYPIFIDVHIPTSTYEQNTDRCVFGIWVPSGTPDTGAATTVRAGFKGNDSADITNGVLQQTTATAAADAHNVTAYSVRIDPMGDVLCGYGTWSSGWPADNAWTYNVGANASITAGPNGLSHPAARLVLAFPIASDASPTTATTIANLRVRRG